MRVARTLALSFGGLTVAAALLAPQASADPDMPPCGGLLSLICGVVPIAPDLDHDIDLTKQLPPAANQDDQPPVDMCAMGCI